VLDQTMEVDKEEFLVVHPLDDLPEEKLDPQSLGTMRMTGPVKWSLLALRAYLFLMIGLILYDVLKLAGLFSIRR
jgi:hypothetical protein